MHNAMKPAENSSPKMWDTYERSASREIECVRGERERTLRINYTRIADFLDEIVTCKLLHFVALLNLQQRVERRFGLTV